MCVCVIRSPSSSLSLPRTSRFWSSFCQLGWEVDDDAPSDQWPYQPVLLRIPDLDGPSTSTCDVLAVWGPCDGVDTAVLDEMIQLTKHLRQGGKIR